MNEIPTSAEDRGVALAELAVEASGCTRCRLAEQRTQVVFGDGAADAALMFVGEGPGKHEDEQGLPFVGPSGRLLEQLLGEIGLKRSEVYIANVVKCRPPGNRDPQQDEIDACKGYLRTQIQLIDPQVVVTLGNFASKLLLRTTTGITRMRGQAYPWWGRRYLVPTFHPAAALRGSTRVLEEMRYDFSIVRAVLDGNLASDRAGETADDGAAGRTAPEVAESGSSAPEVDQLGLFH